MPVLGKIMMALNGRLFPPFTCDIYVPPTHCSFLAVLSLPDGGSTGTGGSPPTGNSSFSLVELNSFRRLTHLSLATRQANDAGLRRYLAARLAATATCLASTQAGLSDARDALAAARAEVDATQRALAATRGDAASAAASSSAAHAAELSALRVSLSQRIDELQASLERAAHARSHAEADASRAKAEAAAARAEAAGAVAEAGRMRAAAADSEAARAAATSECATQRTRAAVADQVASDKQALLDKTHALLASACEGKAALEESCVLYKATVGKLQGKLEAAAGEIGRGNDIIGRLREEYRALKAKARAKAAEVRHAQAALHAAASEGAELRQNLAASRGETAAVASERSSLQAAVDGLQRQLGETREELAQAQSLVAWLNRQLNDLHTAAAARGLVLSTGTAGTQQAPTLRPAGLRSGTALSAASVLGTSFDMRQAPAPAPVSQTVSKQRENAQQQQQQARSRSVGAVNRSQDFVTSSGVSLAHQQTGRLPVVTTAGGYILKSAAGALAASQAVLSMKAQLNGDSVTGAPGGGNWRRQQQHGYNDVHGMLNSSNAMLSVSSSSMGDNSRYYASGDRPLAVPETPARGGGADASRMSLGISLASSSLLGSPASAPAPARGGPMSAGGMELGFASSRLSGRRAASAREDTGNAQPAFRRGLSPSRSVAADSDPLPPSALLADGGEVL